jgi:hypothetical protein
MTQNTERTRMTDPTPRLLRHGEYVSPGLATPRKHSAEKPEDKDIDTVRCFAKDRSAANLPQALGWIKAIYADAIEYTGTKPSGKGIGFFIGLFGGVVTGIVPTGVMTAALVEILSDFMACQRYELIGIASILFIGIVIFLVISVLFIYFGIRMELFCPLDLPLIFDRKHRKVYLMQQTLPPGKFGVLEPWPVCVCEYDWDLVEAAHEAQIVASAATLTRYHLLVFKVRKSATDPTLIDSFRVGSGLEMSEDLVASMWEHIRRFMERGGPHLPSPEEPLASFEPPKRWTQSVGASGVLGEGYMERWHTQPFLMGFFHLAFVVTFPMSLIAGTGHWLSFKTAFRVAWPDEVKQAVGDPIRTGSGWM